MAYEDYCAACTYLTQNGWCERKGENHKGSDPRCYSFCEAYSRSNSARENLYEYTPSSGCYLTTIMCDILGFDDYNYYLNKLRNFRDSYMKKHPKYFSLLMLYDIAGPMIAYELDHDKDKEVIAATFFNNYIVKAVEAINEDHYETAINIYKAMTYTLAKKYNINMDIINNDYGEISVSDLGHGRVKKRVKES